MVCDCSIFVTNLLILFVCYFNVVESNNVCPTRSSTTFTTSIETTTFEVTLATNSTGSTAQAPFVIHDTANFFDDPTNIAVVTTAAGVVGLGAMFVTGYMIVSHGSKITSLCAK